MAGQDGAPWPRWGPCPAQGTALTAGSIGQMALEQESRLPPASETRGTSLSLPEPPAPHPAPPRPRLRNHGVVSATAVAGGDSEVPRGIWWLPPGPPSGAAHAPGGWAAAACGDTVWWRGGSREQCQSLPTGCQRRVRGRPSLENSRTGEVRALDRPGWGRASRGPQHGPRADWLAGQGRECWAGLPPVRKSPG